MTKTMTKFEQFCNRKAVKYGDKFDRSTLCQQFVYAYNTGARVEVAFANDKGEVYETKRGTIGVTTGWKPVFLLMLTARSTGSMYTLGQHDKITGVVNSRGRVAA